MPTSQVRNGGYLVLKDVTSDGVAWKPTIFVQAPVTEGNIAKKTPAFQNQRWWNKVPARKRTGCLWFVHPSSYVSVDATSRSYFDRRKLNESSSPLPSLRSSRVNLETFVGR
jgi:hypothetical protein